MPTRPTCTPSLSIGDHGHIPARASTTCTGVSENVNGHAVTPASRFYNTPQRRTMLSIEDHHGIGNDGGNRPLRRPLQNVIARLLHGEAHEYSVVPGLQIVEKVLPAASSYTHFTFTEQRLQFWVRF